MYVVLSHIHSRNNYTIVTILTINYRIVCGGSLYSESAKILYSELYEWPLCNQPTILEDYFSRTISLIGRSRDDVPTRMSYAPFDVAHLLLTSS